MEINNQILEALGLSLVHSLWQGAALLFLVLLTLVSLRNRRAKTRYSAILFGILALPCVLAANLYFFWPETIVDNSPVIESAALTNALNLPIDFQPVSINPQSNSTVLWLKENASTIAMIWFVGMALFLMKVIGSFVWMRRLTIRALPMKGEAINTLLERAKAVLGISKKIQLKSSSWIKSPVILGIIRPTILFPIGLIEGLSVEEVEAILYHELAHLKRNDFVINIIINVLQIIFFYHPAYWWLKSQLDNEREYATDELALQHSEKKLPMIKALAKVQAFSMNQPALAFAGNSKNQVLKRINIMMNSKQQPNWLSAIFTIAILLVAFGVMSVQDTNPKSEKKNEAFPSSVNIDLNSRNDSILVNIRNGSLEFDIDPQPQDNDSSAVSKAILEFVSSPESIKVGLNSSGEVTSIARNGSSLNGHELTVYKKAYTRLSSFSKKSYPTNGELEELREQLKAREEEIARRQKNATQIFLDDNGKIDSVLVNGRLVEGEEKERYVKEFEQSRVYSSYNDQLQALEMQYHQVSSQVEQLLNSQKQLDQNKIRQIKEYENRMAVLDHQIQQVKKATQYNRQIEQELIKRDLEKQYLRLQDSLKKVAYPGNTMDSSEVAWINKYQALLKPIEERLMELNSSIMPDNKRKIEVLERQLKEIKSKVNVNEEFVNIAVPKGGDQRLEFAKIFLVDKIHPNTLIEMDGEFHPSMKLADLTKEDILSIESIDIISGSEKLKQGAGDLIEGKSQIMRLNKTPLRRNVTSDQLLKRLNERLSTKEECLEVPLLEGEDNSSLVQMMFRGFDGTSNQKLIMIDDTIREEQNFKDINDIDISRIEKIQIIKGRKMEEFVPKRKLKGIERIIKVIYKK